MATATDEPKLQRWQFSLRKFVLLVTLFSVLAVGFWRYRAWGRELSYRRSYLLASWGEMGIYECATEVREIDRKHWLPMKVYELTSFGTIYEPPIYVDESEFDSR